MFVKRLILSASLASGVIVGSAEAAPILSGTFFIDIYQGDGGGDINQPGVAANDANPLITGIGGAGYIDSVVYNGPLNFLVPQPGFTNNTIADFLASGGGSLSDVGVDLSAFILSAGDFSTTTVFDIRFTATDIPDGNIVHDDGISLYNYANLFEFDASFPVSPTSTNIPPALGGQFRLVYVSANDLPEQLQFTGTTTVAVPEPATLAVLGMGLLGLGFAVRQRRLGV